MAHGQPDWGVTAGAVTTYQLSDMGELAARLGSPDTYDRRGEIVFQDDFEGGLVKWNQSPFSGGSRIALDFTRARSGSACALVRGSGVAGDGGELQATLHPLPLSGYGVEATIQPVGGLQYATLRIIHWSGGSLRYYECRINAVNNTLERRAGLATWIVVATIPTPATVPVSWHTLKLVMDAAANKYVRVLYDDASYDISGGSVHSAAAANPGYLDVRLQATTSGVAPGGAYFDDAIITANEPA